ncbi:MAG: hypothetical protein U0R70_15115 [Solirubrobacteraceae bacterium]
MNRRHIQIRLDLELSGDGLTGLATDGNATRRFSGWLGLIAALDAMVRDEAAAAPAPITPNPPEETPC